MTHTVRILSIDGGGIRGIIPAMFLAEIEQRTGKPISALFDMFAGTSTGGLLALGLTMPDADNAGQPRYSARDIIKLYQEEGSRIFSSQPGRALIEERYPSGGIETVLQEYFGETMFRDALGEVLITAYDIQARRTHIFKTRHARAEDSYKRADHDFPMWQVARATSAAPTYFEVARLEKDDVPNIMPLVDGGVFANNPALCAYVEARKLYPEADILLVSLGTGRLINPLDYDRVKGWGIVEWIRPLLDIVLDSASNNVEYLLGQILPPEQYYRFQIQLDRDSEALDNVSADNIRRLIALAAIGVQDQRDRLDRVCAALDRLSAPAEGGPTPE
ncbi:MAG: patatin-like phospholipase family protein [Anaerolineae bacterium]